MVRIDAVEGAQRQSGQSVSQLLHLGPRETCSNQSLRSLIEIETQACKHYLELNLIVQMRVCFQVGKVVLHQAQCQVVVEIGRNEAIEGRPHINVCVPSKAVHQRLWRYTPVAILLALQPPDVVRDQIGIQRECQPARAGAYHLSRVPVSHYAKRCMAAVDKRAGWLQALEFVGRRGKGLAHQFVAATPMVMIDGDRTNLQDVNHRIDRHDELDVKRVVAHERLNLANGVEQGFDTGRPSDR